MKIVYNVIVVILALLAISSGITKIMLMPADAEFFGRFGFTDAGLIAFGSSQVIGGMLLALSKYRFEGSVIVAIGFLISLVLLLLAGDYAVAAITLVFIGLLSWVMKSPAKRSFPKTK